MLNPSGSWSITGARLDTFLFTCRHACKQIYVKQKNQVQHMLILCTSRGKLPWRLQY